MTPTGSPPPHARRRQPKLRGKRRKSVRPPPQSLQPIVDDFRAQHLALAQRQIITDLGRTRVIVDETESPLAWLARRRGRDGRALIEPHQLQAGERLRADFTVAHLMPRTGMNWESVTPIGGGQGAANASDSMVAARQRVHLALDAVGPEMSGLLMDVCCFLKRLEDVERERVWPARS